MSYKDLKEEEEIEAVQKLSIELIKCIRKLTDHECTIRYVRTFSFWMMRVFRALFRLICRLVQSLHPIQLKIFQLETSNEEIPNSKPKIKRITHATKENEAFK